jgi:hypothetical protein
VSDSRQTESSWNRISGLYPRTRSKRVYIHPPLSDTLVEVRPDFTLLIKDALGRRGDLRRGHGFFIGEEQGAEPQFLDFQSVEQSLLSPQEAILCSSIKQADFDHNVTSLTLKASDGSLRIYQYLSVTNLHPTQARTGEWYFLNVEASHRDFYRHVNEDYVPYESRAEAWFGGMPLVQRAINEASGCLIDGEGETILRYKTDPSSHVEYVAEVGHYRNVLKFQINLAPGETKQIQIEIFDTLVHKRGNLEASGNDLFLDAQSAIWQSRKIWRVALSGMAGIQVPEQVIQSIFDTAKTNTLQLIAQQDDGSALPGQGGFNDYTVVYTWEAAVYLRILSRLGATDTVKKTLQYFLSTQAGSIGPAGDIMSPEGSFRAHIFWMGETGSVLALLADYYLMTKDREWLEANLSIILKACDWVSRERNATKVYEEDGTKVAHYGLLPKGRVHDWPDKGYFFLSNATTWQGFDLMAAALADIGHPAAAQYVAEANDYKQCILASVKQATYELPEDRHVRWISNEVYTKPDVRAAVYAIDGPTYLMETGLIDASDDIVPEIEYVMRKRYAMSDLFAVKLPGMEDAELGELQEAWAGAPIDLYYVNNTDKIWHRVWSMRGEREKALRYFYATMAYSTTLDTMHVHERFSPQLQWLSPWQPNGSGNGRIMEMILNSLYLLEGNTLHLLPCIPADWLDVGKAVQVSGMATFNGALSFRLERSSQTTIDVDIHLPAGIEEMSLHLFTKDEYVIQAVEALSMDGQATEWSGSLSANTLSLTAPRRELKFKVALSAQEAPYEC